MMNRSAAVRPQNAGRLGLRAKTIIARRPQAGLEVPRLTIRPARVGDVPGIHELILYLAERKLMIRRSMAELYESVREFIVAVDDDNRVVGCVGTACLLGRSRRDPRPGSRRTGPGRWASAAGWWTPAGNRLASLRSHRSSH